MRTLLLAASMALIVSRAAEAAAPRELSLTPWMSASVPRVDGVFCVDLDGNGDSQDESWKSWGADAVVGLTRHAALWTSLGMHEVPRGCERGTDTKSWMTAGILLSTRRSGATWLELGLAGGGLMDSDAYAGAWLVEGRIGCVAPVRSWSALEISGGARREDNRPLSFEDFFVRAGLRLGRLGH